MSVQPLRSVLVPLDGSVFGEHALPVAAGLARRAGADLHVVLVHAPDASGASLPTLADLYDRRLRADEAEYLAGLAGQLGEGVRLHTHHPDGDVGRALEEAVGTAGADLVVLSTHGHGALSRFWLGSVADHLVRTLANTPLLLVRPQEVAAELRAERTFRSVLVPLDGSPLAEAALEPALAVGRLAGASFRLLRVVPTARPALAGGDPDAEAARAQAVGEANAYLEGAAERVRAAGLAVTTRVTVQAHPAAAILDEAEATSCDLIALATHGRGGYQRWRLGSVADKVVRGSHVPTLVYRSQSA